MSTSLFVRRAAAPSFETLLDLLDVPRLALVGGELRDLREWPDHMHVWVPGESARGIEITRDGDDFVIVLRPLASRGDYELAVTFAELLAAGESVRVEPDREVRSDTLRAELLGEWMLRDMAAGIAAAQAVLAAGTTVRVDGPMVTLEIEPHTPAAAAPATWSDVLRRAQVRDGVAGDAADWERARRDSVERRDDVDPDREHREVIEAEERALADDPMASAARPRRSRLAVALFVVLTPVMIAGLVVRLVTVPIRGLLFDLAERRRRRARACRQRAVTEARTRADSTPDECGPRLALVNALVAAGMRVAADRELVAFLSHGGHDRDTLAALYYHQSVVRGALGLPKLAARARREAEAAGLTTRKVPGPKIAIRLVVWIFVTVSMMFVDTARLSPD